MKKDYLKPAMRAVKLRHKCKLLAASPQGRSVKGNVFDGGIDSDEGYNGDIR